MGNMREAGRQKRQESKMGAPGLMTLLRGVCVTQLTWWHLTMKLLPLPRQAVVGAHTGYFCKNVPIMLGRIPDKGHKTHRRQIQLVDPDLRIPKAHNLPHNIEITESILVILS